MYDVKRCVGCDGEFIPKYSKAQYCSKACANSHKPRRKKQISHCVFCGNECSFYRDKYCDSCKEIGRHRFNRSGGLLPEETTKEMLMKRGGASAYDNIRARARKSLLHEIENGAKCEVCGWEHHVEVCHVKPISDFPLQTTIDTINARSNLRLLCPNCHWLFDHK